MGEEGVKKKTVVMTMKTKETIEEFYPLPPPPVKKDEYAVRTMKNNNNNDDREKVRMKYR